MSPHLTHEQLCDFVLDLAPHPLSSDFAALQQHLANCPACTAELASLRGSISLFRDTTTACARQQLAEFHASNTLTPRPHAFFHPIYWATAAAMIVAAAIPLTLHRPIQPPPVPAATVTTAAPAVQSDEALLEEINQEISAPVPSPMQPLADPTATSTAAQPTASQRTN
jgi:anti-sigma factor RsiW